MLPEKEEQILQEMINRLVEIGRKYEIEVNIEKSKVMRLSKRNYTFAIYSRKQKAKN